MENADKSLEEFSKYLLVTVFSIFAFASSSLLSSTIFEVKVTFIAALIFAIASMSVGFRAVLCKVNELIKMDEELDVSARRKIEKIPLIIMIKMRKLVMWQYYFSLLSLIALLASIIFHFNADNFTSVFIKNL